MAPPDSATSAWPRSPPPAAPATRTAPWTSPRALSHYRSAEAIVPEAAEQRAGLYRIWNGRYRDWGIRTEDGLAATERASAIGIQRALRDHAEKHPEEALAIRVGLHTGEVVKEGDDFFGEHVALAARVAGAAKGGEILVSSLVKELADTVEIIFGPPREVELRGFSKPRRLHDVRWERTP